MADPLSLIASGIALSQLAGTVIDNALKLRRLFNEVKEIPEELAHLLQRIDYLDPMLWSIEDEYTKQLLPETLSTANIHVQSSLRLCRGALDQLKPLLTELQFQIDSSRKLRRAVGKVKVLLKKDVLAKYEKRLDSSLNLLSQSQQMYTTALVRIQPDITVLKMAASPLLRERLLVKAEDISDTAIIDNDPEIELMTKTHTKQISTVVVRDPSSSWLSMPIKPNHKLGSLAFTGRLEIELSDLKENGYHKEKNSHPHRRICLRFPSWLSYTVWDCMIFKAQQGWTYHFRTYNDINASSPAVQYISGFRSVCFDENLRGLQKCFENKEASIYDRDKGGRTLLHLAIRWQPELAPLLIDQGADIDMPDFRGLKAVAFVEDSLNLHMFSRSSSVTRDLVYQNLLPSTNLDEQNIIRILSTMELSDEWFHILLLLWPDYSHPSNAMGRLRLLCEIFEGRRGFLELRGSKHLERFASKLFCEKVEFEPTHETEYVLNNLVCGLAFAFGNVIARDYVPFARNQAEDAVEDTENSIKQEENMIGPILRGVVASYGFPECALPQDGHLVSDPGAYLQLTALFDGYWDGLYLTSKDGLHLGRWNEVVTSWLVLLQGCGVDLLRYGEYQEYLMKQEDYEFSIYVSKFYNCTETGWTMNFGLVGFNYGAEVADWKFWWTEPTDQFAGDFWTLIERSYAEDQEFSMPGNWIE